MKQCIACAEVMPLTEFYTHPESRDGHAGICKECHKLRMRDRGRTNPAVQAYDRARAKTPERKASSRAVSKRWREEHPEAYRAQTAVGNAIRDGKIKRGPCAICGTEKHVHAHHKNYSHPLDVTWLCAKCHHRLHATFPELGGHHDAGAQA